MLMKMNQQMKRHHLSFYELLQLLIDEQGTTETLIQMVTSGHVTTNNSGAAAAHKVLTAEYDGGARKIEQFLRAVAYDVPVPYYVEMPKCYATQKSRNLKFDGDNTEQFFGILLFSGYHSVLSENMFWSISEDLTVPLVSGTMSQNRFQELKRSFHTMNNTDSGVKKDFRILKRPVQHELYFNNYVASYDLLEKLAGKKIRATRTIRNVRTQKLPIMPVEEVKKKERDFLATYAMGSFML
ncbi:hypothetical protein T4E_6879 [Trichinella pseudospiralis]|uniref:PiggyBac transposable element-derived protein domain-containing protein n=1 Tax=Trichinella pseudospiralis TaxID=6337 RepID=A0A0V0XHP3_TRIPS|nr:hypothetical protein T4E_6879 [Trichinella pseudospiralis]